MDPPAGAQMHASEGTVQVNLVHKRGPKLAPGTTEINGDSSAFLLATCDSEEDMKPCVYSYRGRGSARCLEMTVRISRQGARKGGLITHCLLPQRLQMTGNPGAEAFLFCGLWFLQQIPA